MTSPSADQAFTIVEPVRIEIDKVKGSRFICDLAPAGDERSAFDFVERIRLKEPEATHHCWAIRLDSGLSRSFDDGEPGGTAGPPILRRLVSAELFDVVAVVTRYYGGTNLGTGGLIRAYGSATSAAIEAAAIAALRRMVTYGFTHPYDLSAAVNHVIAGHDVEVVDAVYEEAVTLVVRVPASGAAAFEEAIVEETAGAVTARPSKA